MFAMSKSEMDTTIGRHHNQSVDDWIHNRKSGMTACLRVLYFYFRRRI